MSLVLGKDVILYVNNNNTFTPIACSRNCVFTTVTDTAGKSTIGSGIWREFKPIANSGTLHADGIVSFDNNLPVSTIRAYQFNWTELQFQFHVADEGGEGVLYQGTLIITQVTETGNYNDVATYSVDAIVSGAITITSTIGNPGIIYYNTQETFDDPTDFSKFITADPNNDIFIPYGNISSPFFYWMAHYISALQKTNWEDENDTGNAGTIGGDTDLFAVRFITINGFDYICYMTRYVTLFNGESQEVRFYRVPGDCLPPTNFAITNITNGAVDTGDISEAGAETVLDASIDNTSTVLTSVGINDANFKFDTFSSTEFTPSFSNSRFTYTGASGTKTFAFAINGTRRSLVTPFILSIKKNGVVVTGSTLTIPTNGGTFNVPYLFSRTIDIALDPGDYIEFNAVATLSSSDTNYLLTQTTGSLTVSSSSLTSQVFTITGAPLVGGIFTVSIYGTLIQATVEVDTANSDIASTLTNLINAAAIPIPLASQPPSVVSASWVVGSDSFTVVSGQPVAASATYLPVSAATVTFDWTEPVDPGITYTIRIINTDLSTTDFNTGGAPVRMIDVRRGYNYKFAIRTNCTNGSSDYTSDLLQFIP